MISTFRWTDTRAIPAVGGYVALSRSPSRSGINLLEIADLQYFKKNFKPSPQLAAEMVRMQELEKFSLGLLTGPPKILPLHSQSQSRSVDIPKRKSIEKPPITDSEDTFLYSNRDLEIRPAKRGRYEETRVENRDVNLIKSLLNSPLTVEILTSKTSLAVDLTSIAVDLTSLTLRTTSTANKMPTTKEAEQIDQTIKSKIDTKDKPKEKRSNLIQNELILRNKPNQINSFVIPNREEFAEAILDVRFIIHDFIRDV